MCLGLSRLAPSPSGRIHLGNIFSFLITWADARSRDNRVIFRMDDLDERCKNKEVQNTLISDLRWLGIDWDGKIVYQSERVKIYEEAFNDLKKKDMLYPCFCSRADIHAASAPHASDGTPIYSGKCKNLDPSQVEHLKEIKKFSYRVSVPDLNVTIHDEIFGDYGQNLENDCGDFIVRRSDGVFAYQLTSTIDDIEMGITRIVRGCDLLASTPRQVWLANVISPPSQMQIKYAHLPMLINENGQRLAKRDEPLDLGFMKQEGFSAAKIRGIIAKLAGFINDDADLSTEEFLKIFNLASLKTLGSKISISSI
jgi:glutamyl-tRNA synthetase